MKVYKSKFDWIVFGFFLLIILIVGFLTFNPNIDKSFFQNILIQSLPFIGFPLLYMLVVVTTKYIVTDKEIIVKCPPFYNKKIPIHSITKVAKTRSLLSAPAPSLDRIEIHYGKYDTIIISPKNKVAFMKDLQSVNAEIVVKF